MSIQSTNWSKNNTLPTAVKANDTVVKANSTTVLATGFLVTNPGNFLENIPSTNWTPSVL